MSSHQHRSAVQINNLTDIGSELMDIGRIYTDIALINRHQCRLIQSWASMTTFARFILALLTIFVSNHALSEEFRVHPSAFGPIRMGMQVEKASSLLGTPLIKLPGTYQENRYVVYPKQGFKGISFGVSSEGVITNVYVAYNAQNIKTNVGLHIGSPAQDLRRLYGEKVEVKAYQCANAFLIYTYRETRSGNYGIVYTVSENGIIEGIMSGDLRAEVEPC